MKPAALHQRLLEELAPPSLVATEDHAVVHMSERVGRYLRVGGGEPSRDLLALLRPELRPDVRTALREAARERRPVEVRGILVPFEQGERRVDVTVRPVLREGDPPRGFFLVLFDEAGAGEPGHPATSLTSPADSLDLHGVAAPRRAEIARDLTRPREAAEDLRAAHAELEDRVRRRTAELEREVREHESARHEVTTLLHRLVHAQEQERGRIARDLHDHLGQQLTALRLAVERLQARGGSGDPADTEIEQALALTRQIGGDIDFLAWELRPSTLDELGLVAALPRFVDEWSAHVGIAAEFRFQAFEPGQLPPDAEVAFYRVAQEALNNIAKHAHASRADVLLATTDGHAILVVEDNGVGFDPEGFAGRGFGLAGMRERAALVGATLHVESAPGKGTAIYLRRPVPPAAAPPERTT